MTTDVSFMLFVDQAIVSFTCNFYAEFDGNPNDGFRLEKACVLSMHPFLLKRDEQGSLVVKTEPLSFESGNLCDSEETETLACYLRDIDEDPSVTLFRPGCKVRRMKLSELLAEQWERDQELQDELYRTPVSGLQNV